MCVTVCVSVRICVCVQCVCAVCACVCLVNLSLLKLEEQAVNGGVRRSCWRTCGSSHSFTAGLFWGLTGVMEVVFFRADPGQEHVRPPPPQNKQRGFPSEQLQTSNKRLQIYFSCHVSRHSNSVFFITGFETWDTQGNNVAFNWNHSRLTCLILSCLSTTVQIIDSWRSEFNEEDKECFPL